jgi:multidrug transporter EmrE-like cation transporter
MWHILALLSAVVLNASANLLLKFGMHSLKSHTDSLASAGALSAIKAMLSTPYILLGLLFFALNVPLYAFALEKFKVSLAYPIMTGCGFGIIVVVAGFSGLQERLTAFQWLGIALILIGVTIVSSQLKN